MKLDKEIIEAIESCDAYFIIAVKDGTNITSIQGKYTDDMETVKHITAGMLGNIDRDMNRKHFTNSLPLMCLISEAIQRFPFFKQFTKLQK